MAALEVLALNESTPQIRAPGTGDTYFLPRDTAMAAGTKFGWSTDLFLERLDANSLIQRNGTAGQSFLIANTYTDASNYERGFFRYVSNVLEIGHDHAHAAHLCQ